jgi:hypothetical protein
MSNLGADCGPCQGIIDIGLKARAVVDGMNAANDLGLTTAVPARIDVLVDARLKPITLGNQKHSVQTCRPQPPLLGRTSRNARCPSVALDGR